MKTRAKNVIGIVKILEGKWRSAGKMIRDEIILYHGVSNFSPEREIIFYHGGSVFFLFHESPFFRFYVFRIFAFLLLKRPGGPKSMNSPNKYNSVFSILFIAGSSEV